MCQLGDNDVTAWVVSLIVLQTLIIRIIFFTVSWIQYVGKQLILDST